MVKNKILPHLPSVYKYTIYLEHHHAPLHTQAHIHDTYM